MEKREQGFTLYKKGMKYAEIATHLDVPLSTVKSWATRYWKAEKAASKGCKKVATKTQKDATQKSASKPPGKARNKGGAPIGNMNAVGHEGYVPLGNQNATKHGGYSKLLFSTFSADKLQALDNAVDEESALVEEIHLLTLRESYLLERIDLYSKPQTDEKGNKKPPLSMASMVSSSDKRDFSRLDKDAEKVKSDKANYQQAIDRKVENGDRLPGNANHVTTTTEANYLIVERLERLLTDVQKQKAKCIAQLAEVRRSKAEQSSSVADNLVALLTELDGGDGE